MGVGAVLPLGAVLPPLLPPLVPQNSTRKTSFLNRGGSSPEALRYYSRRPQALLPFGERYYRLERYYRSESGTTAGELRGTTAVVAVLPRGPTLCLNHENKEYSKETRTTITSTNELRIEQTQACWL